jgi:hypothetical protein
MLGEREEQAWRYVREQREEVSGRRTNNYAGKKILQLDRTYEAFCNGDGFMIGFPCPGIWKDPKSNSLFGLINVLCGLYGEDGTWPPITITSGNRPGFIKIRAPYPSTKIHLILNHHNDIQMGTKPWTMSCVIHFLVHDCSRTYHF